MTTFVQYKTTSSFARLLANSIDSIARANASINQFNARFDRLDKDFATRYLEISDYDAFAKAVKTITEALSDSKLVDATFALDQ